MKTPMTMAAMEEVTCHPNATICSGTSCLVPPSNYNEILSLVLSIVLTVMLAMVMFAMGCTVEARNLLGHIKRPWGIFIGFLCQFGIMPFTAFALSLAFNVLPVQAVVIIIMGCCPGGSSSNIIAYWLDGDMDLSISMTACSSILALGMMPLCLLIYTSVWTSVDTIQIPYQSIGITLVSLLIPVALGIYVKNKWPKIAKKILKVGSIVGFLLIIIIAVVGGVLYQSSWTISPSLWIIGAIYPFVGFTLGFFMARFVGQPWYSGKDERWVVEELLPNLDQRGAPLSTQHTSSWGRTLWRTSQTASTGATTPSAWSVATTCAVTGVPLR